MKGSSSYDTSVFEIYRRSSTHSTNNAIFYLSYIP